MHPDAHRTEPPAGDVESGLALLHYEISRVRCYLETHGDSPTMRERLQRLEDLLEVCLAPPG